MRRILSAVVGFCFIGLMTSAVGVAQTSEISTDLLIVGGTESGCAAAIQAARMGVRSITLVNDIDWLGGQFSAEGLVAIDENRGPAGYGHGVPFPRSGIFAELMLLIEAQNERKYGVPRPGNTRVITTCLPVDAQQVFRELLQPYLDSGQVTLLSHFIPEQAILSESGSRITGVRFRSTRPSEAELIVHGRLTIDASDWGDVIQLSGAAFEFGPDLKSKYDEPLAPHSREDYPATDMNPITYCMVLKESGSPQLITRRSGFDRRNFDQLPYPADPSWIYESRRLVDSRQLASSAAGDAVLLCFPAFDYPLDVLPLTVVEALEASATGASQLNIVQMTRQQRQIVFDDAKRRALDYLYYLQSITETPSAKPELTFRHLELTNEFGTPDRLPPKPYIRESLRLKAMYQLRQQDTLGVGGDARNYAVSMVHDPIACWQFEYDFHPTRRRFLDDDPAGPWHPTFRTLRTWGPPYSGRAQFPLRCVIPQYMNGLLGAQKNLGYSSIVSSAVRLHDQSVAIGQGVGAVAAVSLERDCDPRSLPWDSEALRDLWTGLLTSGEIPQTLWPFRDLEPQHRNFVAINQLAVRQLIPLAPNEIEIHADAPANDEWQTRLAQHLQQKGISDLSPVKTNPAITRGEFLEQLWTRIHSSVDPPFTRQSPDDADADGIPDNDDPLPLLDGRESWQDWQPPPESDGLPDRELLSIQPAIRFNFSGPQITVPGFTADQGLPFDGTRTYGWQRSIAHHHRQRGRFPELLRDTFLFTRTHDTWEAVVMNGAYRVTVCVGDAGHEQTGQNVTVEGHPLVRDIITPAGQFHEATCRIDVEDGRLTIEIGRPGFTTNTCLNWLIAVPESAIDQQ